MIKKTCEWCGCEFVAKRSSAKFCSDRCKTANHRYKPQEEINFHLEQAISHIGQLQRIAEKDDALTLAVVEAIMGIGDVADWHTPSVGTWWHNRKTGSSVQGVTPGNDHRGDDDEWIILNTSSRA